MDSKAKLMKYTVIIEEGAASYGVFVPNLPGCIAAGETREEALELIREAIGFHLEGLKEDGKVIPEPRCEFAQIEVNAT